MNVRPLRVHWTVSLILLACLCLFFGFGGYAPGGAHAAVILFYILLALSFVATFWSLARPV